jgi:hypothetical protein
VPVRSLWEKLIYGFLGFGLTLVSKYFACNLSDPAEWMLRVLEASQHNVVEAADGTQAAQWARWCHP